MTRASGVCIRPTGVALPDCFTCRSTHPIHGYQTQSRIRERSNQYPGLAYTAVHSDGAITLDIGRLIKSLPSITGLSYRPGTQSKHLLYQDTTSSSTQRQSSSIPINNVHSTITFCLLFLKH